MQSALRYAATIASRFMPRRQSDRVQAATRFSKTLGMAIYMGAGPSVMYAAHALDAYKQFAEKADGAVTPAKTQEDRR